MDIKVKEARYYWSLQVHQDGELQNYFTIYNESFDGQTPPKFTTEDVAKLSEAFVKLSPMKVKGNPYEKKRITIEYGQKILKLAFYRDIDWFLDRMGKAIYRRPIGNEESRIKQIVLVNANIAGKCFENQQYPDVIYWETEERAML